MLTLFEKYSTHLRPDAKRARDARARELRKAGWTVVARKHSFMDLARSVVYTINATKPE